MTECRINEYCIENNEILLFVNEMNSYLQEVFEVNIKKLASSDSLKLVSFLIASYLKDLNECNICFKAGLLNSVPLLLKKIIETWRYIIYYYYNNGEEAKLLYSNDSNYEKPRAHKLNLAVDAYIKDFSIHLFENDNELFYRDFIRKYYEVLCAFSHLDILALKVSVLDSEAKINFYINAHKEMLNRFLTTILILQRLMFELYANILKIDDIQFMDNYKLCILNLNKINDARLSLEKLN